ncbi:MAG: serine hydrolase domain-containing protein [Aestuariivirga sp.]
MDSQLPAKLRAAVKSGLIPGLHACLIVRNGAIAAEAYFEGEDANWGRPIGMVKHGPGTLHDLRSVTKSIVSLLYGIALGRGLVPPPEAPLMAEFPHFADLAKDVGRQQWTIAHALTMSLGTEWNEEVPYTDPANSEIQMEHAADRSRFVLDRPLREAPGTRWVYNGGTSALIAEIIERGTGKSLLDFAHEALFVPLGIVRVEWNAGRDGKHSAASGLRLSARDLSRIGQMLLERGRAGGLQIVSGAWIDQSTAPRIETGEGLSYGYQWWLGAAAPGLRRSAEQRWFAGFRNGGQRLFVMPAAKLAMVTYFGNYDRMDSWKFPIRLWWEIVLPSLVPLK